MDLYVLDRNFATLAVFDVYESFIWTDRYSECGDFEAVLSPGSDVMQYLVPKNYIWRRDSEHVMIIKRVEIKTNVESGPTATVTGESLESLLMNRVIARQTVLSGSLQNGIRTLLNQTIIRPSESGRKISNFVFLSSSDSAVTSLTLDAQYFGENLYDVICEVCDDNGIGFKITLSDDGQFVFQLYAGIDRSWDQTDRPYIVFSPHYDNLLNSNYVSDIENVRNVAYIVGEDPDIPEEEDAGDDEEKEEKPKPLITTQIIEVTGSVTGIDRKEIFVDGSSLKTSYRDDEGQTVYLSEAQYRPQLIQRGREELAEYYAEKAFDGEVIGDYQWVIGQDYFMGDIVQVENEYGMSSKSRVVEMITSESSSGESFYPSFESLDD